ncbi:hypothetical protein IPZ61_01450 [Streptomyces sioyaensis]|uniref:hypothetical protein n=1 Tax=Streptomyces sioyaensis TaxID=67364 RepID=UPI001F3BD420|nr:hypothetical protein [Streptomyces sioyaensis]MCF3172008.1 hypothetical protein [Streptomyces sioyaensis]
MIRPTAFRALPAVAVTAAPALPLAQGAQAAAPSPVVAPSTAAVGRPSQVRLVDADFMGSHPRVEVRYGGPAPRTGARVVASVATLM